MNYNVPLKKLKDHIDKLIEDTSFETVLFIDKVEYGIFDGRSCGRDNYLSIKGICYEDGEVKEFFVEFEDIPEDSILIDLNTRFFNNCYFGPNAFVDFSDATLDCDIKIAAENIDILEDIWNIFKALNKEIEQCGEAEFLYHKCEKVLKAMENDTEREV